MPYYVASCFTVLGYCTFILFFFFWQNIRDVFFRPRLAFLDKLTIPQEDADLKEKCILGLAGFLRCSRKLVILFSECYTDRVWCVYEFATFMQIHGGQRAVEAIPVALPMLFAVHVAWWFAVRLLVSLVWWNWEAGSENMRVLLVLGTTLVLFLITYPCQSFIGKRMTKTLEDLRTKLYHFNVQDAKCFCCSSGHVMSGETVPCDRELIYQSFSAWYDTGSDSQTGLERFNQAVRHRFAEPILQACGGSQMIPLHLFIYAVCSVNTPLLITRIPMAFRLAEQETSAVLSVLVASRDLIQNWFFLFPSMLLYLWANKLVWRLYSESILLGICSAALVVVTTFGSALILHLSVAWTDTDSWIPFVSFTFFLLLTRFLLGSKKPRPAKVKEKIAHEDDSDSFSI
eukprot:Skav206136  [mRNA]  locus=scaffold172:504316:505518:- [translate_table: standard]